MKPEWGTKRTCHRCATHFYDLNKAEFGCPKCEMSYTPADFMLKHPKISEGTGKKELRKKSIPAPLEDRIENIETNVNDNLEEEDLIEDAADLDDEDVTSVIKHENESE